MKALIVANWKMNPKDFKEAKKLLEATKKTASSAKGVTIVVAPPHIFLRELAAGSRGGKVAFAAQNAHFLESGSYTGEISLPQVKDAKAGYVIVGHAERRLLGETNDDVKKKVAAIVNAHLTPIVCVGESQREPNGEHFQFIREQIDVALADTPAARMSKVVIAYEPVWAIGATKAMQPTDMREMSIFIRKTIVERYGEVGLGMTILYGGSVDATNAAAMMREGDVKGLLVGRASTDAEAFSELIKAVSKA